MFDHETSRTSSTSSPSAAVEALVDRDEQRGRVGERNEADAQFHLNSSAAVITDWATSAIFLFSFIAVLRSSA